MRLPPLLPRPWRSRLKSWIQGWGSQWHDRAQTWQWYLDQLLPGSSLATLEACLIGLISGLMAVVLKQGAASISLWRAHWGDLNPLSLPLVGLVGGGLAGWLIQTFAPETQGSGIPQVKVALAPSARGYPPVALNLRVALVKLASTMLVLGSGMVLGRQGPTVQVGAAIAGQLSQWIPTSPDYRRQLLAAGAAAGLAAGFNAPLAGVLFVVEELLQDASGITLGTAILASFIGAVVSRLLGGHGLQFFSTLPQETVSLTVQELPLVLLLGIAAGLLGGLFSRGVLASRRLYQRFLPWSLPGRVAVAGFLSGCMVLALPDVLRDNGELRDWLVEGRATAQLTAIAFLSRFVLVIVATGSGASGGLFAPALVLGAALGYGVPLTLQGLASLWPGIWPEGLLLSPPATYALTGMGAFFSAVTKGPITAIVIVFEMSSNFNLVLPLMIGSLVAKGVSDVISPGSIYDRLLDEAGIHLEPSPQTPLAWETLRAADVMAHEVETLSPSMTLASAKAHFADSNHRGFPVMADSTLMGILSQSDVAQASTLDPHTPISALMTPHPVTVQPGDTLAHVLYLLNRHQVSRLPVTDGRKLVGIITRADIIRAEAHHIMGSHCVLGSQTQPSYVVYQTRAPALGRGRILVPLSNPATAPTLVQLAAAIARDRHYELECLTIITIPPGCSPAETPVDTAPSLSLLQGAQQLGQDWNLPVHTQIRVTHDVAQAILDTIRERRIDLTLMGWKGGGSSSDRVLGDSMATLIRQAPSQLVLVKLGDRLKSPNPYPSLFPRLYLNRWLLPLGGGPNAQAALSLLPALVTLSSTPEVILCHVQQPGKPRPPASLLRHSQQFLRSQGVTCPLGTLKLSGETVSSTLGEVAEGHQCDVVLLGASGETLLAQVLSGQGFSGNIPEAIAQNSPQTIMVVRTSPNAPPLSPPPNLQPD